MREANMDSNILAPKYSKTIKEIVNMLNTKGITTSHNTKITINIVTDMLKNRRYIGEYRSEDIVQKDGIPRIVPQALFDKVQTEREKNKRATARHKAEDDYLLTTKAFGLISVRSCDTINLSMN